MDGMASERSGCVDERMIRNICLILSELLSASSDESKDVLAVSRLVDALLAERSCSPSSANKHTPHPSFPLVSSRGARHLPYSRAPMMSSVCSLVFRLGQLGRVHHRTPKQTERKKSGP